MLSRFRMFALCLGLLAAGAACKQEPSAQASASTSAPSGPINANGERVTAPTDARALAAAGAPVIDVRTQEEWDAGHLDQAKLIPVTEFAGRISEIDALVGGDKSKPVVIICRSGGRSEKAKAMLLAAGYQQVINGGRWENLK